MWAFVCACQHRNLMVFSTGASSLWAICTFSRGELQPQLKVTAGRWTTATLALKFLTQTILALYKSRGCTEHILLSFICIWSAFLRLAHIMARLWLHNVKNTQLLHRKIMQYFTCFPAIRRKPLSLWLQRLLSCSCWKLLGELMRVSAHLRAAPWKPLMQSLHRIKQYFTSSSSGDGYKLHLYWTSRMLVVCNVASTGCSETERLCRPNFSFILRAHIVNCVNVTFAALQLQTRCASR